MRPTMSNKAEALAKTRTDRPFPEALGELLRVQQGDPLGMISLSAFFSQIGGYSYDALRRMVRGELTLQPQAIEAMAAVLGVAPEYFLEYRSHQLQEGLRRHPELADVVYEMLMASFALLDERQGLTSPPVPARRRRPRRSAPPAEA
jgi:hypothetical protein